MSVPGDNIRSGSDKAGGYFRKAISGTDDVAHARHATVAQVVSRLAMEWSRDIEYTSSYSEMKRHGAFRKLVELGKDAITPLLDIYQRQGGAYFLVLQEITGENPVPRASYGDMRAVRDAWTNWGRAQRLGT